MSCNILAVTICLDPIKHLYLHIWALNAHVAASFRFKHSYLHLFNNLNICVCIFWN